MKNISVDQLNEKLQSGENLHVIDVREQNEYDQVNIGAKLLPLSKLRNMDADAIEDWREEEVIVHCHSGKRSLEACLLLEQMGFGNTVNVEGGIMAWTEKFGDRKLNA